MFIVGVIVRFRVKFGESFGMVGFRGVKINFLGSVFLSDFFELLFVVLLLLLRLVIVILFSRKAAAEVYLE